MIERKTLVSTVGASDVIDKQAVLDQYASDMSFVNKVRPCCIVKPNNTEEIKEIIKLARETKTPLVPVSSGQPHFRGDTIPSIGGAIIVDLSGMKKIIRVDRLNRVAMFEPGVTFGELIPAVTKEKLRLNIPLLPRSTKSVTGSMLEREPVILPKYHWDIADPLNCVEIIFGNGDMFRTGAAAGPGNIEEQWAAGGAQVEAAGPSSASWYRVIQGSQGTMGIVTWSSARCELLPSLEEPFMVGSSDLEKIMEIAHWLIRLRIPNECFILNNVNLAAIMAEKYTENFLKIRDSLPTWILFYNLAGYEYLPEERISIYIENAKELSQRVGVIPEQSIGRVSAFELLKTVQLPSAEPYWKIRAKGSCQDIFCITNFQKVSGLIDTMFDAAEESGYPVSELGIYVQPIVQGANYHVEFNLFYDRENKKEASRVHQLSSVSVDRLISKGGFFSRPYGENVRAIMNRDAATVTTLNKVKLILDPDKIMNPGKLCF
jgi:hypothetical protein